MLFKCYGMTQRYLFDTWATVWPNDEMIFNAICKNHLWRRNRQQYATLSGRIFLYSISFAVSSDGRQTSEHEISLNDLTIFCFGGDWEEGRPETWTNKEIGRRNGFLKKIFLFSFPLDKDSPLLWVYVWRHPQQQQLFKHSLLRFLGNFFSLSRISVELEFIDFS